MKRPHAAALLAVTLIALVGCADSARPLFEREVIDLTHTFDATTIYWPTGTDFELELGPAGYTERGYYYSANSFCAPEHGGTHLDAPVHFAEGRQSVDAIPTDRLIGPGVKVDVAAAVGKDRDYLVTVADLEAWEAAEGPIPEGAFVLLDTGSSGLWPDRERYMGTARRGAEAVRELHFPGLSPEAATWLAEERKIRMVGLDTPSIDHGPSESFDAHVVLFERNVPALENVANLDRLPAQGFTVMALPMKIGGGTGAPVRILAILD